MSAVLAAILPTRLCAPAAIQTLTSSNPKESVMEEIF